MGFDQWETAVVIHDLTVLLTIAVTAGIGCITLAWAAFLSKDRRAVLTMSGAYLLLVVVALSSFLIPADLVVARALISNSAHLLAAALLLAGILHFFEAWRVRRVLLVTVLLALAGNAYLTLIYPDRELRLLLFNASFAGLRLATVWALFRAANPRDQRVARGLAVVMLLEALAAVWRASHALSGTVPVIGLDLFGSQGLLWVIVLISTATSAPLLMLLAMSRVVRDYERTAARLRSTLDAMPDMVFEVGPDGRYASFHYSQPELLAAPPASIIGRMPEEILPEQVIKAQRIAMAEVDRDGRSSAIQYSLDLPGGTRWFEVSAAAREADIPGCPHGYVFVVRDVTERRQIQDALHYRTTLFNHLFERSPIALILSRHSDRRILEANAAFLQMMALTAEQLTTRTTREFIAQRDLQTFESLRKQLQTSGACGPAELNLVRDDGQNIPIRLSSLALVDPDGVLLIWTMVEDLTERNRIERLKSEFLSLVSHELRTPLTSIVGALDLLAVAKIVDDPAQRARMLEIARNNGHRLRLLIDDLLDMDKLLAGKMRFNLRDQALAPLLETAIEANRTYSGDHLIHFEVTQEARRIHALVDGDRLLQVMANLLSNASKFAPPGSAIVVSLSCSNGVARIAVRDHGPGVPESFRPYLFHKFMQAESGNSRMKGGSGLGLAIVRELVVNMRGQVAYESAPGGGARFVVNLPISGECAPLAGGDEIRE